MAYKRSLKETTIDIHPQTAITKDNVHVHLDGAVYTRVVDAYKASYGIEDPEGAITTLAQSAMRKEVGNLELDQLFLEREKLNIGIAQALDEASQPWGIRVFRYEIADIHVERGTTAPCRSIGVGGVPPEIDQPVRRRKTRRHQRRPGAGREHASQGNRGGRPDQGHRR